MNWDNGCIWRKCFDEGCNSKIELWYVGYAGSGNYEWAAQLVTEWGYGCSVAFTKLAPAIQCNPLGAYTHNKPSQCYDGSCPDNESCAKSSPGCTVS